jgi:putative membrane protein
MKWLLAALKGFLIGIANVIPGVSGGTFALILGIYERLMRALGSFGGGSLKVLFGWLVKPSAPERRRALLEEIKRLDLLWLLALVVGVALAILSCSRLMAFFLDNYLSETLAFFVGLILPSLAVPYRLMDKKGWKEWFMVVLGTAGMLVFNIVARPAQSTMGYLGLFVCGAVAISAMILPGISGSYVLMVLGQYRNILEYINTWQIVPLVVFALGCVVGLLAFVRLLNWLLARHRAPTMGFLIGLILGSLWVLWPFKEIPPGTAVTQGINVLPPLDLHLTVVAGAFLAGLAGAIGLDRLGRTQ